METLQPGAVLRDVTPEIAEDYARDLLKTKSAGTFNKHINLLALVCRTAAKKARLTVNPWLEIPRKKITGQSRR